jgi:hypothetical protein
MAQRQHQQHPHHHSHWTLGTTQQQLYFYATAASSIIIINGNVFLSTFLSWIFPFFFALYPFIGHTIRSSSPCTIMLSSFRSYMRYPFLCICLPVTPFAIQHLYPYPPQRSLHDDTPLRLSLSTMYTQPTHSRTVRYHPSFLSTYLLASTHLVDMPSRLDASTLH